MDTTLHSVTFRKIDGDPHTVDLLTADNFAIATEFVWLDPFVLKEGLGNIDRFPVTMAEPDILIGTDHYFEFTIGEAIKAPNQFYVLNSILGPLLGGNGTIEGPKLSGTLNSKQARVNKFMARKQANAS